MTGFIKLGFEEGHVFNRWLYSRLIRANKNVLGAELGGTGSGKSYRDLRKVELWYNYYFKQKYPTENICFSVKEVIDLISSGKLRKGEVIIFEEAGANLGSLDFQNKISKMFTYVLQSFRSMNIAIFMNLPYLSMLNKQARMLLHYTFESDGVDIVNKTNRCKPKFLQINQTTGKVYPKYMKVVNEKGKTVKVKRMTFSMPSEYLIKAYEEKKKNFLLKLTGEFSEKLNEMDNEKAKSWFNGKKKLTPKQEEMYELDQQGLTGVEIAKTLKISSGCISRALFAIEKKGYNVFKGKMPRKKDVLPLITHE